MAEREERRPLFKLDLGKNGGGTLAPYSGQELLDWAKKEVQFWSWLQSAPGHSHKSGMDNAYGNLTVAQQAAQRYVEGHDLVNNLNDAQARIRSVFMDQGLPHSSTVVAKEVEKLRGESPERAVAYLFAHMPNPSGYRFESSNGAAWHAYILGLFAVHGGLPGIDRSNAQRAALDEVLAEGRSLLAERRTQYDVLHADLQLAIAEGREQAASQGTQFTAFMDKSNGEHTAEIDGHKAEMLALRKAFREEMSLRGPVEYWSNRESNHKKRAMIVGGVFAALLVLVGVAIWLTGSWAVATSVAPKTNPPDTWRLAVVGFVAAIGVWMLRLVVRMFLSDQHLATDAAERVTMVKTYLALIESDKLPKDEDRKLILQALFRPGSDGIVKDEGLPNPVLDAITKVK